MLPGQFEVVAEGLGFPEGPVVMPDGSVLVVEIFAGRVTRCWGGGRTEVVAEVGGGPNGAALGPDGALYICNNGGAWTPNYTVGRIERLDLGTGKVERLYDHAGEHALGAPNDLVFDAHGGIWFTDFGRPEPRWAGKAGVYYCKPDGGEIVEASFGGFEYNGVGLSPDGGTLYVATTGSGRLYSVPVDAPGVLSPPLRGAAGPGRVLAAPGGDSSFDSLAVTASGSICVASLWPYGVTTVTPGGVVSFTPLPDTHVTNIAFGGDDMRDAYVTLSNSGRLVKMRWPEPGLRLNF